MYVCELNFTRNELPIMDCINIMLTLLVICAHVGFLRGQMNDNNLSTLPAFIRNDSIFNDVAASREYFQLLLDSNDTLAFLSTFENEWERHLVYQQLKYCPYLRLCGNYSLGFFPERNVPCCWQCSCTFPTCMDYGTCCLDLLLNNIDFEQHVERLQSNDDEGSVISRGCGKRELGNESLIINSGMIMYDSCPTVTDPLLENNCTREYSSEMVFFQDILPVMNTLNGDWYRNVYCAYCNNVSDASLIQSGTILKCKERLDHYTEWEIIDAVVFREVCVLEFNFNGEYENGSCTLAISECNTTGRWYDYNPEYETACSMYRSELLINDLLYKNIFCALCNGIDVIDFSCKSETPVVTFTFSGLLKLENTLGDHGLITDGRCSENQLDDYYLDVCRDLFCSPFESLRGGRCLEIFSSMPTGVYTLYLKIFPSKLITLSGAANRAIMLLEYLQSLPVFHNRKICAMHSVLHSIYYNTNGTKPSIDVRILDYFKVRFKMLLYTNYTNQLGFYETFIRLHNSVHIVPYVRKDGSQKPYTTTFELADLDPGPFDVYTELNNSLFTNGQYLSEKLISLEPGYNRDFRYLQSEYSYDYDINCHSEGKSVLNVLHFNSCPKVLIQSTDYKWRRNVNDITFLKGKFTVNYSDIYFDMHGDMVICADIYRKLISQISTALYKPPSPLALVSVVSSALSIASLIITLVVLLALPRLRNSFHGRLNISLVLVLVCAQSLYLVSSMGGFEAGSPECIAVGILLHFMWLLSILWMNVCTYHLFYVITRLETILRPTDGARFTKYHAYAVVMALIPIMINVIVSMTMSNTLGYGAVACYISSQYMTVYTFGIPVVVIITCNIAMYFVMVYKIGRSPSVRKNVKNERNDFLIFVKLSTVTGATWIFGFIYTWTDIITLSYLFILFNAGQGIFIMMSLVLNKRVLNMFRTDILGQTLVTTVNAHVQRNVY